MSARAGAGRPPRIGLFGKLGSGNIGNDASMESVLGYLAARHPDAVVDAMCTGPEWIRGQYGIDTVPMFWYQRFIGRVDGVRAIPLKALGKGLDAVRIASWVRRHDAVIVPGMGVLEASLPLGPLEFPYALFLLSVSGRLLRTKVALVSVGAGVIKQPVVRTLFNWAARAAFYRSYRNENSRDAMRQRGLDVSADRVFPDLAFAVPVADYAAPDPQAVGVGVMAYYGSNADRAEADEIYAAYIEGMKHFVRSLVDSGRTVRLILGDTNGSDDAALQEIMTDLTTSRPDLPSGQVVAEPVVTFADIVSQMAQVSSVVATRFHNLVAALMLARPTIAISYSPKHDALMADMGVGEFCQPAKAIDNNELIGKFGELEKRSAEVRQTLREHYAANVAQLDEQYALLDGLLFQAELRTTPPPRSALPPRQ